MAPYLFLGIITKVLDIAFFVDLFTVRMANLAYKHPALNKELAHSWPITVAHSCLPTRRRMHSMHQIYKGPFKVLKGIQNFIPSL